MNRSRVALLAWVGLIAMLLPNAGHSAPQPTRRLERIPVHFPDDQGEPVTLDAEVMVPSEGSPPFPAVILNHGFGGSRTGDGGLAERLTEHGYIVLRYSSRGFGDTPGEIDLVGQKEQQDLLDAIHWLNDPTNVPEVWVDHIGQLGGSYGGGHAMMLATLNDPAIKAIAPLAAYIDFYRGLAPYNVAKPIIVDVSYGSGLLFPEPGNNVSEDFHRIVAALNSGIDLEGARQRLQLRSILHKMDDINVPMFFAQGWNDSFFEAQEAIDAFTALRARGVPTFLYIGGVGHPPANPDTMGPEATHIEETQLFRFFDRYIRGIDNGFEHQPPIEFSNASWDGPTWDGTTMRANAFPVGTPTRWSLCPGLPSGTIITGACPGASAVSLVNTYANANPTGEPLSGPFIDDNTGIDITQIPPTWTPADTATFVSASLTADAQMTGIPRFGLQVISKAIGQPSGPGPLETFQLDPRIYDVAPDGGEILVTRGAYSENVDAPVGPHTAGFEAFGFSYRFAEGHRIKVVLATNDAPYLRPASNPFSVVVRSDSWLELPGSENIFPNS